MRFRIFIAVAVALTLVSELHAARYALIVGINDYSATQFPKPASIDPMREWPKLNGAVNDATTMSEMLRLAYGFTPAGITTLLDQQASRAAIFNNLDALAAKAQPNDVVLFYFAGHGSQVRNSLSDEPDKLDESIIPADSRAGALDIRDKELRPYFNRILDRGARLTIILDNCHSGSGARALGDVARGIAPDLHDVADPRRDPRPENRGALVLTASQDSDQAFETFDTADFTMHGAFSWSLFHAMRDAMPEEPASDTFLRADAILRTAMRAQAPSIAGTAPARSTPLLGGSTLRRHERTVISVDRVERDGTLSLIGGWADGLTPGCELRDRASNARAVVTVVAGLARSRAVITRGSIAPGALLELTAWAAPPSRPLRVWIPRVAGNVRTIAALARSMRSAAQRRHLHWVTEPERATDWLLRRGAVAWELVARDGRVTALRADTGSALEAIATLPRNASFRVQLPASQEIATSLEAVQAVSIDDADYGLAGRLSGGLRYAWLRLRPRPRDPMPARTTWIAANDVLALQDDLARLRKIHAWEQLDSPPAVEPYRLSLRHVRDQTFVNDGRLIEGERYELVLRAFPALMQRAPQRYTYVFEIDSTGKSTLLFPVSGLENRIPVDPATPPAVVVLQPPAFLETRPPFGVETFFLLTSDERLPNPWVLEWSSVRTRAPRSNDPLQELLAQTNDGTRAVAIVTPSNWTLQRLVFESTPRKTRSRV